MKKIIYHILILFSICFITNCDSNFEEINSNPNTPTIVSSNSLLAGVIRNTATVLQDPLYADEYVSRWIQHLGKTTSNTNELYIPLQNPINNTWFHLYSEVAKNADIMQKLALEEGNDNIQGIALTLKANAFHILTDTYGDIPFTQALKADEGITTPIYDDSKSIIYPGILSMLDEAIGLLNGNGEIESNQDLLYTGDYTLWRKFASSLKFKVLMRAASGGYNAAPELQELVNNGHLFSSNNEDAKLTFLSVDPNTNPFSKIFRTQWSLGEELVNYMNNTLDPRLSAYAQEAGGEDSGNGYIGKPAGIKNISESIYGDSSNVSLIGNLYLEEEQPSYFLTYAHLSLLMAEAVEKGYISGNAEDLFYSGIEASADNNGVTGLPSIDYSNSVSKIEEIQKQIWVATFMQGFEAWAEWRRTGIPKLPIAIDAVLDEIPTRYTYPSTQQSLNRINYLSAVEKLGGNDDLTTPLWWQNQD